MGRFLPKPSGMRLKIGRSLPIFVTISLFLAIYLLAALRYPGLLAPQVFFYLLVDNAYLLISAIGMTFVILTGGIDLSVGAMIAFTAMLSAWMVEKHGVSPALTIPAALLAGTALGAIMGSMIQFFKTPPFVATLAGLFFARGMCYVISVDAIRISDPFYQAVSSFQVRLPGGTFLSLNVIIALIVVIVAAYVAHNTSFGRSVYAIGGGGGANEVSATLMGLPTARIKVLVYTLNGFCSALAGVAYSFYMLSAHGSYANGMEMDVIAAVVIGGTPLTGGEGYMLGTVFGVLIQGLIQTIIIFDGTLNTWWTKIVVGLLTLAFILMQRGLTRRRGKKTVESAARPVKEAAV